LVLDDVDGLNSDRSGVRRPKALGPIERLKRLCWHSAAPLLRRFNLVALAIDQER
jgi:hypothetical protein